MDKAVKIKIVEGPSPKVSPHFYEFYLQEPCQVLIVKTDVGQGGGGESPLASSRGRGKVVI